MKIGEKKQRHVFLEKLYIYNIGKNKQNQDESAVRLPELYNLSKSETETSQS